MSEDVDVNESLSERDEQLCEGSAGTSQTCARCSSTARSSARRRSPTRGRWRIGRSRSCERNGVAVEVIRAVDHEIATGVYPDMTEHGWERDEWPAIFEQVMAADILVLSRRSGSARNRPSARA